MTGIATTRRRFCARLVSEAYERPRVLALALARAIEVSFTIVVVSRRFRPPAAPPREVELSHQRRSAVRRAPEYHRVARPLAERRTSRVPFDRESAPRAFRASSYGKPPVDDLRGKIEARGRRRSTPSRFSSHARIRSHARRPRARPPRSRVVFWNESTSCPRPAIRSDSASRR